MAAAATKPTPPTMQPTQKSRPNAPSRESGAPSRRPGRPAAWIRVLVSVWIVWHFTGVFLAALSLPPSSQLVVDIAQQPPMQWYLDALYLNQGHSFFAPEVGPGHLIKYELLDQSGRTIEQGEIPNTKDHTPMPRLRYHRHLMLADQADLPGDKETSNYWQRKYLETYARHMLRIHENAQTVRLQRLAHWPLPRRLADEEHRKLDDPEGYELLMDVTQRRSDLDPDGRDQSQMWQGRGVNTARRWMGAPR
jgi:hypothetical protein